MSRKVNIPAHRTITEIPLVSIIIPAYNAEQYIGSTIASIQKQRYEDIEIIVVDDGSTDSTASIVSGIRDSRIRLIKTENSGGPSRPRNIAIEVANGEYICIFDADDIMLPGKIEKSINALQVNQEAAIAFTDFNTINENGILINERFLENYRTLYGLKHQSKENLQRLIHSEDLLLGLGNANFIGTSSVMIHSKVLKNSGGFDETIKNGDDYDLWVRLALENHAVFIDKPLHQYRIHQNSISKSDPEKRSKNLINLHLKHIQSHDLPEGFKETSKKKLIKYSTQVVKSLLKRGDTESARIYANQALKFRFDKNLFLLATLTYIPKNLLFKITRKSLTK